MGSLQNKEDKHKSSFKLPELSNFSNSITFWLMGAIRDASSTWFGSLGLDLSKLSPDRARWDLAHPRALVDRAWTEIPLPKKNSWPKPGLKYLFQLFYNINYMVCPPRPGLGPKKQDRLSQTPSGTVMGEIILARNSQDFLGLARARSSKCSHLIGSTQNLLK